MTSRKEKNWELPTSLWDAGSIRILVLDPKATASDILRVHTNMFKHRMPENDEYDQHTPLFETLVYANRAVIKKYEQELKEFGVPFYSDWETNETYADIMRKGISLNNIFIMEEKGPLPTGEWAYRPAKENEIEIINLEGMVDIIPRIKN